METISFLQEQIQTVSKTIIMQSILFVALFGIIIANYTAFSGAWLAKQKKDLAINHSVNSTTKTFDNLHAKTSLNNIARVQRAKLDKETVQKVLIRTCNGVYQKGILNKCPQAASVHTTWKFLEDYGLKGGLSSAWSGTTTSTFSCGSEGDYGRYLLHNSLTQDIINLYGYDLNGITDTHVYPCGYSEIVYQL